MAAALLATAVVACAGSTDPATVAPLPEASPGQIRALLSDSEMPVVLNVWGSWCIPCRSEAPLLHEASTRFAGRVRFVGIDVRDSQDGAAGFIAEFGLEFENYFDPSSQIPADLGGFGVPLTFFFRPGGELVARHDGVIDERTLALQIDELVAGAG